MISVSECTSQLIESASKSAKHIETEESSLIDAQGKILAQDVLSEIDVPPTDNSAMDGFVFRHKDIQNKGKAERRLQVSQRIIAGSSPSALEPGTAARIFTGGEIPAGADTVEMQENCAEENGAVAIFKATGLGKNIRRKGQDIRKKECLLKTGRVLRAQELGLLASIGLDRVKTFRPLRVALLNTGNELVEPGQKLGPGKIYNSNRYVLDAILRGWGFNVTHAETSSDNFIETKNKLQSLASMHDVVISTGGVSVGEEDHIKPAVEALGQLELWKVAIKPGKPFTFGSIGSTAFLGLPGNPASVFVTLLVLGRPYLLARQGLDPSHIPVEPQTTIARFSKSAVKREEYLRAKYDHLGLCIHENQSSGVLSSASWGNCLALQPIGEAIAEGSPIKFYPYTMLFTP